MKTIVIDGREVIDVDADPDTPSDVADAHQLVKELEGGCKVKVVYDGQGQPSSVEVTDAALGEGADKVAQGVVDAAKQAQGEALVKMKAIMQDMQKDIAKTLQADMK